MGVYARVSIGPAVTGGERDVRRESSFVGERSTLQGAFSRVARG
jgi:hypothetical protein